MRHCIYKNKEKILNVKWTFFKQIIKIVIKTNNKNSNQNDKKKTGRCLIEICRK